MKNADKQYTFESEAYTVTIDGKQDNGKATENGDGSGKSVTLVKCGKLGDVNVSRAVKMRIPKIIS